jgi:hypothetical protein
VTPAGGASAVPASEASSASLSGGSGIMPAGTRTGVRGASLDWDRQGAGNARCNGARSSAPRLERALGSCAPAASQEDWPDAEPWGRKSLWREPLWNADRRAHLRGCAPRASAEDVTQRLPAFCFLSLLARTGRNKVRDERREVLADPFARRARDTLQGGIGQLGREVALRERSDSSAPLRGAGRSLSVIDR